jgi:hypothetical protein
VSPFHMPCLVAALLVLSAVIADFPAQAQTRSFVCPHNHAISVTVINKQTISASPIDGAAMTLKQAGPNPFNFINGDYAVTISPDQSKATVDIPDYGVTVCQYRPGVASAALPGLGHADLCGPGFHQVPETDDCAPNASAPANARPQPVTGTAEGRFPMPGLSLGGIVRAAPTQESPKIASLGEGDDIMILNRERNWDGYSWFKIRFHGRTGYQWGGIMCSQNPIRGILEQCRP